VPVLEISMFVSTIIFSLRKEQIRIALELRGAQAACYVADPEVKRIQILLVKAGYKIAVDGLNGPATTTAVKSLQKASGLVVDGIPGKLTIAALDNAAKDNVVRVSNPKT
jgi:peptidoglycan hydrolase-like protein with peptidoglycan-binding domain